MEATITQILEAFESGRLSRREVIGSFMALLTVAASGRSATAAGSPFQAVAVNHVALRVTDLSRSKAFYGRLLGMPAVRENENSCFLDLRSGFLALFRREKAAMDHFCLAVDGYDVERAKDILEEEGLNPRQPRGTQRIYFKDPDGIEVQLSAKSHKP